MSTAMNRRPPPTLGGTPLLGPMPSFRRDPTQTLMNGWRQCGGVFRFQGPLPLHVVTDADGVKHILEDNAENYQHPPLFTNKMKLLMGEGIITSEGESWLWQRQLILPAFHKDHLPGYATLMSETISALVD